jgi:hypothetical protein
MAKRGHSNVAAGEITPWPDCPDKARVPLCGGATAATVRDLPPLAIDREEWERIGQAMGWTADAELDDEDGTDEDEEDEEDAEPEVPGEEDITTRDRRTFYYCGKKIAEVTPEEYDADTDAGMRAVAAWCDQNNYFPDVWFVNERGTPDRLKMSKFTPATH